MAYGAALERRLGSNPLVGSNPTPSAKHIMKEVLGFLSLTIGVIGYIPYIKDTYAGKTKPHAFSWLVWSTLSAIAFAIQITHNAGPGAWLMCLAAIVTFYIFILALKYGEKHILAVDWLSLLFAAIALLLWFVTNRPLLSVILIASIDVVGGFFPTFRKSIRHPEQETVILYFLYAISLALSLLALQSFTLLNAIYPASFVAVNLFMVIFLSARRDFMRKRSETVRHK